MHLVRSDEMSIEVQLPAAPRTAATAALPPGFRFHPTDEELILHYLRKRAAAAPCPAPVIAEVDIYKFDPWELPAMAVFGEAEWYFFSPRDRKYPNGVRPNRAAGSGYWKATGTDKPISGAGEMLGVKKALVFYRGRPPKGIKTSWIMHEYRLADATNFFPPPPAAAAANITTKIACSSSSSNTMRLDEWVLCRIYKKTNQQLQHMSSLISMDDDDGGGLAHAHQHQHQHHHHHHHQHRLQDSEAVSASISDYLVDYSAVPPPLFDNSLPAEAAPPLQLGFTAYDGTNKRQRIEDYYSISSSGGFMSSNDDEMRQQLATTTTTMPPLINIMFEPTSGQQQQQQQLLPSHHQDDTSI